MDQIKIGKFIADCRKEAGYYQCSKCGTKRIPSFTETLFAPYLGRSRFMKCQSCQKYHWHGKVVSADSEVPREETKNFSQKINKQKNRSLIAGITITVLSFILVIAFIMTVYISSKNIPLNVQNGSLSIKSLFYPTEIPVEQIETEDVRVINLADEDLKMNLRINGIGLPNCRLGWYKSAGQKYKVYITDKTNVVFIPTKDGYTILYSSPDAKKIVENIKSGVTDK